MSTYRYIAQRQAHVPVRQLCQTLHVSASAYYAWQRQQLPAPEPAWLAGRQPPAGLVVPSDQGSQYSATNFKDLVARHEAVQRMSRRGNC